MPRFRRARAREDTVTVFFATDIHGSEICWRKFISAAHFYRADLLILGGDFTGKLVIPIVATGSGRFRARFMGKDHEMGQGQLAAFERRVADAGFYPARIEPDHLTELEGDPGLVDQLFQDLMTRRLIDWIEFARTRLSGSAVRVLTAPANDDPYYVDDVIAEHGDELLTNVEGQVVEIAPGHEMISTGYTNRTPWNTPREHDEDVIEAHIEEMAEQVANLDNAVFNLHPPPHNTRLDLAPKLDDRLEVVTAAGAPITEHVGSKAVHHALARHQPMLSLHGHIHESAGRDRIGRTTAINPGSEYGEGILKGALIRLGAGRIQSYQATSG